MSLAAMRLGVVLHLALAVAAIGGATHAALFARPAADPRRLRRVADWAALLTVGAMVVGALIYPRYKVDIRVAWLDANAPGAARLFDLKEQLVALALPMQIGAALLVRRGGAGGEALVRLLSGAAAVLLWAGGLLSAWVVSVHAWR